MHGSCAGARRSLLVLSPPWQVLGQLDRPQASAVPGQQQTECKQAGPQTGTESHSCVCVCVCVCVCACTQIAINKCIAACPVNELLALRPAFHTPKCTATANLGFLALVQRDFLQSKITGISSLSFFGSTIPHPQHPVAPVAVQSCGPAFCLGAVFPSQARRPGL